MKAEFTGRVDMTGKRKKLMQLSAGGLMMLAIGSAHAVRLEEVIVTAQKRVQFLQDVPAQVTAFTGDTIDDMAIMRLDSLTSYIPNVTVADGTSSDNIFIRGVGSGTNLGFEQSVGLYIDGLYFGRGRSTKLGFLDLERIEVLKGPQGILFGKNTIAGAINITTKGATAEPEGYVNVGYEFETKERFIEAAYGGPITDTIGSRLAIRQSRSDGWMDNDFTGDRIQGQEETIARLTTTWDAADTLTVTTKLQYSNFELDGKPAELSKCNPALAAATAGTDDCRFNGSNSAFAIDPRGGGEGEEVEAFSALVAVDWDVAEHTLSSITGFTKHIDDYFVDVDFTYQNNLYTERDEKYQNLSQEFRIVSPEGENFEYIAGLYYERNELDVYNNFHLNSFGQARTTLPYQEGESRAVFGQLAWNISDEFRLTIGGRYSEDEKELEMDQWFSYPNTSIPLPITTSPFGEVYSIREKRSDYNFSPAFVLEWTPHFDHMFYFKYSEGFKAGGFDLGIATADLDNLQFAPEQVDSIEVGSKSTLMDGAMTLNLSLFNNEYSDLQVSTYDGLAGFNVGNAAEATSRGAELEVAWRLHEEFTSKLALSYLDAEYDKYTGGQCNAVQVAATPSGQTCVHDLSGEPLQYAPRWSGHLNLTWERPLNDIYLLNLSTDIVYSDSFHIANDLDPNLVQGSYHKIDVRAALINQASDWEIALIAKNLNDESTFHFGSDVPLASGSYFKHRDVGRTVALQARKWF